MLGKICNLSGSWIESLDPSMRVAKRSRLTIASGNRTTKLCVTEGDWGSVLISVRHSLRPRFRSATSLREGGKAAAPQLPHKLPFDFSIYPLFYVLRHRPSRLTFFQNQVTILITMTSREGQPWTLAVVAIYRAEVACRGGLWLLRNALRLRTIAF